MQTPFVGDKQFLRIDSTVVSPTNAYRFINLGEIQLFNGPDQLRDLESRASMSSWYGGNMVGNCFDGYTNSICHSSAEVYMNDPWLQVDITGLVFDTIVIYNREDGCGSLCSSRIVGARIALIRDDGVVEWSSTFATDQPQYTFEINRHAPVSFVPTFVPTQVAFLFSSFYINLFYKTISLTLFLYSLHLLLFCRPLLSETNCFYESTTLPLM